MQYVTFIKFVKIFGVCSSKNVSYVSTICDVALAYDSNDLDNKLKNEEKFDLIFDTVSSGSDGNMQNRYINFLSNDGKYIQINGGVLENIKGYLVSYYPFLKNLETKNHHLHYMNFNSCQNALKKLDEIFRDNDNVHIKLEKFELNNDGLKAGFDRIKSRRAVGKIIFEIKPKDL